MAQYFKIHPDNPQVRLLNQAALILQQGGVMAYPTDSCYALGCLPDKKSAFERILSIRRLNQKHNFTLLCSSMTVVGSLARTDNTAFRLMKRLTPGPYTFLLRASHHVPRYIQHPKKKTIGLRIPAHDTLLALLELVGEPLLSTSLILPHSAAPETDPEEISSRLGRAVDLVIDAGPCGTELTTVIDLTSDAAEVVRQGLGRIKNNYLR
jgi:tRNA threonylcarbamoyl adenosine modification protein (Sua5/YciO/YrdC/YwlC family)